MVIEQAKIDIARRFSQAANDYDKFATLQRRTGHALLNYLPEHMSVFRAVDLGCGSGQFMQNLSGYTQHVIGIDLSQKMLHQSRRQYPDALLLQGDAEQLPLDSQSVDLIFSNLALQWCSELSLAIRECWRVLKPGGQLVFSTLITGTLFELAHSFQSVDQHAHIRSFLSMEDMTQAIHGVVWTRHQCECRPVILHYSNLRAILADLKGFGANHLKQRRKGLMTPAQLRCIEECYRMSFVKEDHQLPVTYQVVYGVLEK
ncbi:MAG: Malonyl-[acyl-carrier protein] O-methyltransferase [Candidatus Celerinatantimonas neptuna]|nr:MAG: Malonyl-[acyl-carrier protein] O-methyltransferase [Candidatus Celerinatantimonas neptuna]